MPTKPPQHRPLFAPKPDQERGTAYERGYDRDWQKLRDQILRENPVCVFADAKDLPHCCGVAACIVDHIVPLNSGGARLDPANLRPVCRPCHDALTSEYLRTGRNEMPRRECDTASVRQSGAGHGGTGVGGANL